MRLLFIIYNFGLGGAERQASILLPGLRRRGVDARALALDGAGPFVAPLRASGVPVEVANMRNRFDLAPLLRSRLLREFTPDLILSVGVSSLYVGAVLARWRDAAHVHNDHLPVGVELSRRRMEMIRLLAHGLARVIVVSSDQCAEWLERGCERAQLTVIPNGIELPSAVADPATRDQVRAELGLPASTVVAANVALFRPAKRVPDFVQAVRRARERYPELLGLVVGDGPERAAVEAAAAGDPAIRLLGHREDVPRLLTGVDLLALSSAHEAMPMVILEAMAAGLPVVAPRVGGIDTVVLDGETGRLLPPGDVGALADALVELGRDPERRRAMGRAGQARCRDRWSAERMIDSYLDVLNAATVERAAKRRRLPLRRGLAESFLRELDRRGWVTWESRREDANVLMVTNAWPDSHRPTYAPFIRRTVTGLLDAGVNGDVLYVRGYRGKHVYLLACAAMLAIPHARPRKYQLVHSHGGETAVVARFFRGAPVLATYWGADLLGPRAGGASARLKFLLTSRLMRMHAPLLTATTTKTTEMEQVLPRRARSRNWVIPDGIDRARFRPVDRSQARAALGWPATPIVVTVSRRSPEKRVWLAEQTGALAAQRIPGLEWRLISDVPPEEMPLYYNAADALLHTAASEGSPNAIKEAVACNLPVVATGAGDIAEVLDGVVPSAVCPADPELLAEALVGIIRGGRRSNGQEHIGPWLDEVATARTLECYRRLGVGLAARAAADARDAAGFGSAPS